MNTKDKKEMKLAQSLGIEVNPYTITDDGELLSSDGNLLLVDENGTLALPDRVISIGEGAFANTGGLKKIIIPGSVKEVKANAFAYNTDLEEVVMEDGVEKIGERAFVSCNKLQKVTFPDTITSIGATCFTSCTSLDNVKLPKNLTVLNSQTFQACSSLKNVELSEKLETIGSEALQGTKIVTIKFPANLKSIYGSSIETSTLKEIDTSENNYYEFKDGILYSKDYKNLILAIASVTSINMDSRTETISISAFSQCSKITTINLTENVKSINANAFTNSKLKSITVDGNNKYFKTDEKNNLYSIDGKLLYKLFDTGNVTIKDGVEGIVRGALTNSGAIKGITLPESFTGYSTNTWGIFPTLDYLYLPKNVKHFTAASYFRVKKIEVSNENPNFKSVDEYILSKDGSALYWVAKEKTEIEVPSTVKEIKDWAFYYSKAQKLTLPKNIEKIGAYILNSSSVKELEIQSKIKTINSHAFSSARSLTKITIDKNENEVTGSPWGNPYGDRAVFWKDSE